MNDIIEKSKPATIGHDSLYSPTHLTAHTDLIVTDLKSTLHALPLQSATTALVSEGRSLYHSNFQPTGRYVKKGTLLTIIVNPSLYDIEVAIGLYGEYANQNSGKSTKHAIIALNPGINEVLSPVDGMVFIQNRISCSTAFIEIYGGQPVPTYIKGVTTREQFDEQLIKWANAPFIEMIGEYIVADFQTAFVVPYIDKSLDLERRVTMLDDVVAVTNKFYGLSKHAVDTDHKSLHRIYISNPDTGPGGASASDYHLKFQASAGRKLLTGPENDRWGYYHEVGHTYQMKELNWKGMIEVTVNISSLAVQEAMGFPNYLDGSATVNKVKAYREIPIAERNFGTISDVWLRLMMFDQLRRGFGTHFYAQLAHHFRLENAQGLSEPADVIAVQQHFMVTAGKITDRNLTPFFEEWGLPIDDETRLQLAKLPALKHPIWDNLNRSTDIIERNLSPLVVPTILISPAKGSSFAIDHAPIYAGKGTAGATITIEQGLVTGGWYLVGTTTVQDSGDWSFTGSKLSAGKREARATQSGIGAGVARNAFVVAPDVDIPVKLHLPVNEASFDENEILVYEGWGTPGAIITIEQGIKGSGTYFKVGTTQVNTNGDWSLIGDKHSPGEWDTRAIQDDDAITALTSFTVTQAPKFPVILTSPVTGAEFGVNYKPIYRGIGTPGITVTVEQKLISDNNWHAIGTALINDSGDWSLIGSTLSEGKHEVRVTQNSDGSTTESNIFSVSETIDVPLTLAFPAPNEIFPENYPPVYSGKGVPGASVYIEQGLRTSGWIQVGTAIIDTNGEWAFRGIKLLKGEREVRVTQSNGGSGIIRRPFTVIKAAEVSVTLTSPAAGAVMNTKSKPVYAGKGTPGAIIFIQQGTLSGSWEDVGTTYVNDDGNWIFVGLRLPVGKREARATQYIEGVPSADKKAFTIID